MSTTREETLWRVVDDITEQVGTLSQPEAVLLQETTAKVRRLRELHASCQPHERQLRVDHLALLTEQHVLANKLLQIRRYCAAHLQDADLPEAERSFLLAMQDLMASLSIED